MPQVIIDLRNPPQVCGIDPRIDEMAFRWSLTNSHLINSLVNEPTKSLPNSFDHFMFETEVVCLMFESEVIKHGK